MDYKKMMTVAGALICASAMADVVSSSVVGYQNVNGQAGGKAMIGATFQKIAGTDITLGDIGVNNDFVELSDAVTALDEYGGAAGVYVYMTEATATEFGFTKGWYLGDDISNWDGESALLNQNSVSLYEGESLMVEVSSDDAALVFAGVVPDTATELECKGGEKTFLSNCTPVDRTLGEITVNADFVELSDALTMLDEYGGAAGVYVYMTAATAAEFGFTAGWYDGDAISNWDGETPLVPVNTSLPAGQGFMLEVSTDGAAVVIPAAI